MFEPGGTSATKRRSLKYQTRTGHASGGTISLAGRASIAAPSVGPTDDRRGERGVLLAAASASSHRPCWLDLSVGTGGSGSPVDEEIDGDWMSVPCAMPGDGGGEGMRRPSRLTHP